MNILLTDRISHLSISQNQLAVLSGVRANQINDILAGKSRPGRRILLQICLALEFSISEINQIFKEFEYEPLHIVRDVSYFVDAIDKRRIPSGIHSLKPDSLLFEIEIMAIEKLPGDVHLVTSYPHGVFSEYEPLKPGSEEDRDVKKFYNEIKENLLKYRKQLFRDTVQQYEINHLICVNCLKEYIHRNKKNPLLNTTFKEMFQALTYSNYKLSLIDECSHFDFHLITPVNGKKDKPVVLFAGKNPSHKVTEKNSSRNNPIFGFVCTDFHLYNSFYSEFERLSEYKVIDSSDNQKTIEYLKELLVQNEISLE